MALSETPTLLPLDEYARIMAIPGWLFNQLEHPARPKRGCEDVLLQSGYTGDPNYIVGRDEIAMAISMAERKLADYLGFWIAPMWVEREPHRWATSIHTDWGYLISAGTERWDLIEEGVAVVYSSPDGDPYNEWAAVTVACPAAVTDPCEVVVVPAGMDPELHECRLRPLDVVIDAGWIVAQGYSWIFTDPDLWMNNEAGVLGTNVLGFVDVYRHWNRTYPTQVRFEWLPDSLCDTVAGLCTPVCQDGCAVVIRERVGLFSATPAAWNGSRWTTEVWVGAGLPNQVYIWYYSGYRDRTARRCDTMGNQLKTAVVRLANCYLPEAPCGCDFTRQRWAQDREEMPMTSYDVALAQSAFGTTMRGAVWARAVAATIPPLGQGR